MIEGTDWSFLNESSKISITTKAKKLDRFTNNEQIVYLLQTRWTNWKAPSLKPNLASKASNYNWKSRKGKPKDTKITSTTSKIESSHWRHNWKTLLRLVQIFSKLNLMTLLPVWFKCIIHKKTRWHSQTKKARGGQRAARGPNLTSLPKESVFQNQVTTN